MTESTPQLKAQPQLLDQDKLSSNCPIALKSLISICDEACTNIPDNLLPISAGSITETVMGPLVKASQETASSYKFIVNVTLTPESDGVPEGKKSTRSSMNAYWNTEKDGSWTYLGSANTGTDELSHVIIVIYWIHCP